MGTFVADDPMTDLEGPIALVVADDDALRAALREVMCELGFGVALRATASANCATMGKDTRFALALLCVGRGTPDEMRYLPTLLASPALAETTVVVATTAFLHALPPLPVAGRAATITLLRMPFALEDLERLAQRRIAVPPKTHVIRSAAGWDGAVEQVDHSNSVEWTQWADLHAPSEFPHCPEQEIARAC